MSTPTTRVPRLRGVLAPVLTPFAKDLRVDVERFIEHCRWLIDAGVGLAVFGTNSEAASLSIDERLALTDALIAAGIPAARMMPGTGSCAVPDAVRLSMHAVRSGAAGVLMLPPFYFKGVSEDGLFSYYSEVIERSGDDRLAVYLYHIPQLTGVSITLSLIERLLKRYPNTVVGIKDSSGDWNSSRQIIEAFADDGFDVFPASESFLTNALAAGGAGCVSATVNVNAVKIQALYSSTTGSSAALQAQVDAVRKVIQSTSMIPAMKHVLAQFTGHASWKVVRPPLTAYEDDAGRVLILKLLDAGFDMPGLPRSATAYTPQLTEPV